MTDTLQPGTSDLAVYFLSQGEQPATAVAERVALFIAGTRASLDIALYDCRLSDPLKAILVNALRERAAAGVAIRIAYDADKSPTPRYDVGGDPAPGGTGAFVQSLGYPWRRIGGLKLMHNKYLIRDAGSPTARVWTGSTNFTDDAWTLEENNILEIGSTALAGYYAQDFAQLWQRGHIENTGNIDTAPISITYAAAPAQVEVLFSPGRGPAIDYEVAHRVANAQRRVRVCSMLLNSGAVIAALGDLLHAGQVPVSGIYDRTQMESVLIQWRGVPHNHWKIGAVQDIVRAAHLVGKNSTPYSPTSPHDYMHDKVLVVDDTVITGSYNFSHSAEQNAENILIIESPALAETYGRYIDHLMAKYGPLSRPLGAEFNGGASPGPYPAQGND
ncbi:MAG TPA: phosphatidylserine/phosphatidylglycerophosphate/cardiolipin synthase family protein [Ktedonobacterales bacterium]|jgi:phosphatidylserine/phosphatidylglycerophosphate/cardiolipin synthase-like enzyme